MRAAKSSSCRARVSLWGVANSYYGFNNHASTALRFSSIPRYTTCSVVPGNRQSIWIRQPGFVPQQRRSMSFLKEFRKALKDHAEDNKEAKDAMEQMKELQQSESLKKAKETLGDLTEGVEKTTKKLKDTGYDKLKEGAAAISETLQKVKEKTGFDEKFEQTINKTIEIGDKVGQISDNIITSAEQSTIVKKTQEYSNKLSDSITSAMKQLPLIEETPKDAGSAASSGALVVRTDKVTNAISVRIDKAKGNLRNSRPYKAYVALKERIVESKSPVVQSMLDFTDIAADKWRQTKKLMFRENPKGKAIRHIKDRVPSFSPVHFQEHVGKKIYPMLRTAALIRDASGVEGVEVLPHAWDSIMQTMYPQPDPEAQVGVLEVHDIEFAGAEVAEDMVLLHYRIASEECHRKGKQEQLYAVTCFVSMGFDNNNEWKVIDFFQDGVEVRNW